MDSVETQVKKGYGKCNGVTERGHRQSVENVKKQMKEEEMSGFFFVCFLNVKAGEGGG